MFHKQVITLIIVLSRTLASMIRLPSDTFVCNKYATIECDTNFSTTVLMTWYLNDQPIADCNNAFCSAYSGLLTHYTFTPGQSPYKLTLNPVKMLDDAKTIACKGTTTTDSTTSDPKSINVEVKPSEYNTFINHTNTTSEVFLNMTACIYPVLDITVKWSSKKDGTNTTLKTVKAEDTAQNYCLSSINCSTDGIMSDITLPMDSSTNNLYYICIEIIRNSAETLISKCTDTQFPLEAPTTTTPSPPKPCWCLEHLIACVISIIAAVCILIVVCISIYSCCKGQPTCIAICECLCATNVCCSCIIQILERISELLPRQGSSSRGQDNSENEPGDENDAQSGQELVEDHNIKNTRPLGAHSETSKESSHSTTPRKNK